MALNRQPLWARAAIVSAGPIANLVLAVCLYAATFWWGQYETQATLAAPIAGSVAHVAGLRSADTVLRVGKSANDLQEVVSLDALRWWLLQHDTDAVYLDVQQQGSHRIHTVVLPAMQEVVVNQDSNAWQARGLTGAWSRPVLGDVQSDGAAYAAGLQRGDEVLRINGQPVTDAMSLRALVRLSGEQQSPSAQLWHVVRDGRVLQVEITPHREANGTQFIGRIGAQVGEPPAKVWVQYSLFDGIELALAKTWEVTTMTLDMLWRLLGGRASLDNLSGPLSMADYAGRSASLGLGAYLSYLALVSVSLGVFNLLPLPMLDGGHLLYYLYEALTGRPPSPQWLDVMQRVGFAALLTLMVFSLFNDVVRLGWLP